MNEMKTFLLSMLVNAHLNSAKTVIRRTWSWRRAVKARSSSVRSAASSWKSANYIHLLDCAKTVMQSSVLTALGAVRGPSNSARTAATSHMARSQQNTNKWLRRSSLVLLLYRNHLEYIYISLAFIYFMNGPFKSWILLLQLSRLQDCEIYCLPKSKTCQSGCT